MDEGEDLYEGFGQFHFNVISGSVSYRSSCHPVSQRERGLASESPGLKLEMKEGRGCIFCGFLCTQPSSVPTPGLRAGTPRWWPLRSFWSSRKGLMLSSTIPNLCKQNPTRLLPQTYGHRQVRSSKSQMACPLEDFQACERECSRKFPGGLQRGKKDFA